MYLKNLERKSGRENPKRTISANGRLGLQILSELDIGQCASINAGNPRGMNCEIPHRLERGTKHSLQWCGNLSLVDAF